MLTRILLLLCVALNAPLASAKETLHIYAASSMTNAVNALVADYSQQHDVKLVTVYGGSSSLARQIEAGAPADLFISANEEWANYLVEKGLVKPNKVVTLAANSLVLIRPTAQPVQVLSCKMPRLANGLGRFSLGGCASGCGAGGHVCQASATTCGGVA